MVGDDLFFGSDFLHEDDEPQSLSLKEGELREVSVLFADIKGFTNISNLFEPEVIHGKMDEIMKIFSRCINFYGGFVDKYIGDGVMALFGAKKASEHDTERCILAAIKMQDQLRLYNDLLRREAGFESLELGLRIGINTGIVSVGKVGQSREGDFTVYGPEVNLASRMESNAPVNRIMLPAATKKMVEHIFEFEHRGLVDVKGMDEPIDCWLVLGQKTQRHQPPKSIFLGRELELSQIRAAYAKAQSGLSILGIQGDAGIGKSRLVHQFTKELNPVACIKGACSAIAPSSFNLFTSIIENQFQISTALPSQKKKELLEAALKELCDYSPKPDELWDALPLIGLLLELRYNDPRARQKGKDLLNHLQRAIDLLFAAFIQRARLANQSLVWVLDDIQYIDDASALCLHYLLSKLCDTPLFILALYRSESQIPESLSLHPGFSEIQLEALSDELVEKLILEYTQEHHLAPNTIKLVQDLAAGNPFYLEEWCNYILQFPKTEQDEYPVPSSLHALILSRLDKLPQPLRMLLHKAAVIGNKFFVEILREVEKRLSDPVDVDSTLQDLEKHSLVFRNLGFDISTYFFKHSSTREVAYQTLLQQNRKMLHQLTAEAIESLFADRLDEFSYALANHYLGAELYNEAIPYLKRAMEAASRVYDNALALKLGAELMKHLQSSAERAKLNINLADIQWLIGDWEKADQLISLAESEAPAKSISYCEIHRFRGMAAFFKGEMEFAKSHFERGYELANELNDPLALCIALSNLGIWHQHHQDFALAKDYHQKSLDLAISLQETQRQAKSYSNIGLIHLEEKDFALAEAAFLKSLEIAALERYLRDESIALGNLAWAYMQEKRFSEAMPHLKRKLELATQMNDKWEMIKALGNLGNIHYELAEYPAALEYYQKSLALKEELGATQEISISKEVIQNTLDKMQES